MTPVSVIFKREQLGRPPLVEALFELRADCATPYSIVPGAMYDRLRDRFPTMEVNPLINTPIEIVGLALHRFTAADGKRMVQCGPGVLTVNVLGDYGAFESFEDLIKAGTDAFFDAAKPTKLHRLGVRYINLLPEDAIQRAGQPLRVVTTFPSEGLPPQKTIAAKGTFEYPAERGTLGLAFALPHQMPDGRKGCLLDLDFFTQDAQSFAAPDCLPWVKKGHDVIYQAFRSSLTATMYRELEPEPARGN